MVYEIKKPETTKWYISFTQGEPYSYGKITCDNVMTTSHETTEEFDSEAIYLARLSELGIEPNEILT